MMEDTHAVQAEVSNIQHLCTHDGPGIRTTVFLMGCPLRCWWCHNPETRFLPKKPEDRKIFYTAQKCIGCRACAAVCPAEQHQWQGDTHVFLRDACTGCLQCTTVCPSKALEAVSRSMSVSAILDEAEKDRAFYGSRGGLTLSGGEPMYQPEAAFAILEGARQRGMTTALESCGFFSSSFCERLVRCVDLFLYDVKDTDTARHLKNTAVPVEPILENLSRIDRLGGKSRMRCILLEGVNRTREHARQLSRIFHSLSHCEGVEILPYHAMGASKWKRLGLSSQDDTCYTPDAEQADIFRDWLREDGTPVK